MALQTDKDSATSGEWFLRTEDDAVRGQLTVTMMREWAEQGRLAPEAEVSRNSRDWVRAESVPELKMDWLVTLKSGAEHGPVNLLAVPALYRRGMVDDGAVLENKITGRKISAAALLRGLHPPTDIPENMKLGIGGAPTLATIRPLRSLQDGDRPVAVPAVKGPSLAPRHPPPAPPAPPSAAAQPGPSVPTLAQRSPGVHESGTDQMHDELIRLREAQSKAQAEFESASRIKERRLEDALHETQSWQLKHESAVKAARQTELRLTRRVNELESQLRDRQRDAVITAEKLHRRDADAKEQATRLQEMQATLAEREAAVSALQAEFETVRRAHAELQLRLQSVEIEAQHREAHLRDQLESREGTAADGADGAASSAVARVNGEWQERMKADRDRHDGEVRELRAAIEAAKASRQAGLEAARKEAESREAALLGERDAAVSRIAQLEAGIEGLREDLATARKAAAEREAASHAADEAGRAMEETAAERDGLAAKVAELEETVGKQAEYAVLAKRREADWTTQDAQRRNALEQEARRAQALVSELAQARDLAASQRHAVAKTAAELARSLAALNGCIDAVAAALGVGQAWYLKMEDGQVFGPAKDVDLYQWAVDCRVGPSQMVARNQRDWQPAEQLDWLGIHWMVKLVNGDVYGPLNAMAVPQLIADGAVDGATPLTRRVDQRETPLPAAIAAEVKRFLARQASVESRVSALREAATRIDADLQALTARPDATPGGAPPPRVVARLARRAKANGATTN